ncbi:MAG: GNAT family N-acetyltransferase [Anaerolineales bacterium]|jgi:GNAT superfamily N-acetyltransferase
MTEIVIRKAREEDFGSIGRLIADVYSRFNLDFLPEQERAPFLGPFQHAASADQAHQDAIVKVLRAHTILVAEEGGEVVGVLRGRPERLASLFVKADRHHRGIGRALVEAFEHESIREGVRVIRLAATLYAVPFYLAMGYQRSTGVRNGWSFKGRGLKIQPMRKVLQT